ncbi:tRNA (cytosine(34)-C(5))-methyltransferase [Frankliniella fusca]|uniref:tRNA (cytosine(34)-C(5))-methyltransferase n=1 Tax=Frankliniella fusca TaxID=407009 RepID=A0AAE1H4W2_9NEOP|nr:tRNA (cytosine(34)-C(5))-methyltransferase [Frankliniella fusca]
MGRRHGIRNSVSFSQKKRNQKHKHKDVWDPAKTRMNYVDTVRESEAFYTYYKKQNVCPESEWDQMIATLKETLPTSFRISGSKMEASAMLDVIEGQFFEELLRAGVDPDAAITPPKQLPWYPDRFAWQLDISRKDIRRSEAYYRLHNFLIAETSSGNISRQEAVSMIPPLVLDVKPYHKVLDMCAAPGSKTAQLIEMLHADHQPGDPPPEGFVVANDMDNTRCYMLVHQLKRLSSPCVVIVNHDASLLPNLQISGQDGNLMPLKFDRILCDVPCTGDGTLRKNPDIWEKWNAANGNNLHGIQYRVARRGLEHLAVGGRMVYSTCSLNPIENEAVLHRILQECEGSVELVDVSTSLPGLVHRPGMTTWIPCSKDLVGYEKYEDVPEQWRTQVRPSMFPPSTEDASKYNLERCIRILPHLQNTGGFFVAVLNKVKALPWEAHSKTRESTDKGELSEKMTEASQEKTSNSPPVKKRRTDEETIEEAANADETQEKSNDTKPPKRNPKKNHLTRGFKEDPFVFFTEDEKLWPVLQATYDLKPELSCTSFLTRCEAGKKKNIYFTTPALRDLIMNNTQRLKIVNTGVKAFVRCDNKAMECCFRLAQEGLKYIESFIGPKRRIKVTKEDLVLLLSCRDASCPPEIEKYSTPTQEALNKLEDRGSFVVEFEGKTASGRPLVTTLVGWKGTCSVRAYVGLDECVHTLRLLGEDVSDFEVNKFKNKAENKAIEEAKNDEEIQQESKQNVTAEDTEKNNVDVKEENDSGNP